MKAVYMSLFFLFGTLFGSFYTVVGLRLAREESFLKGRSHCDFCMHPLGVFDLIPIFSYLFLGGRCRYCKEKISPLSFFIEITTGILFMLAYYSFGFGLDLILLLLVISMAMILFASDLTEMIIPDGVLLFFGGCLFLLQIVRVGLAYALIHLATSFFLFFVMYGLMLLGNFLFKKESLGGGDIKMLFVFGLVLDPILGLFSIFLGSLIALPISFLLYLKNKEHIIPFGPFLLVSLLLILFSKITSLDFLTFLGF